MAVFVQEQKINLKALEIISEIDDSLDKGDLESDEGKEKWKEIWDDYCKDLDRAKLPFIEGKEPTVFLCNFELSGKQSASVKNSMLEGKDEDGQPKVAMGSWSQRVVQHTLKDIQNPSDLPKEKHLVFKKDDRARASATIVGILDRLGIVNEIFGHYTNLAMGGARTDPKN